MTDPKTLLEAVLAVQAEPLELKKHETATVKSEKGSYTYTYISLDDIVEKVGPLLNKHGLVWMTKPGTNEHGQPVLNYVLAHAPSGEREEGAMSLLLTKTDPQGQGSAITYARRYALTAVLNLVADDDDDGHAAGVKANGSTDRPSDKQITYLKSLVTKSKAPARTLRAMLDSIDAGDVEIAEGWVQRLSRDQVSKLIEMFKQGVLPDPAAQDIPNDAEPAPEVEPDDDPLPFDEAPGA